MTSIGIDEVTRRAVDDFLFREARLLDEHDYEAWFALWADEVCYWVPSNRADIDPQHEVSIIYDDRERLADRIFRIGHPAAHAYDIRPRTARVVSNIEADIVSDAIVEVHSSYVLVASRRGDTVFGARTRHTLVRDGDGAGFKMTLKKVLLTANDDALRNLTFLP